MATQVDNKSAKKRKAKADSAAVTAAQNDSASHASDPPSANHTGTANGDAAAGEHPYIKELSRYALISSQTQKCLLANPHQSNPQPSQEAHRLC